MPKWLALGALMGLLPSCMHTSYSTGLPRAQHAPAAKGTDHFFLYGLVNDATISADRVCTGTAVSRVTTQKTFVDGLLSLITAGIYTPRSHKVWCAAAPAVPVQSPADGAAL